jgi:PST family polysaccharide transporter
VSDGATSYRRILRTSSIIGGASAINIFIGIVKVKVLAVLLGPAGVGLMGLYQNIMSMASTLAGCGLGSSGVRQLAASSGEVETLVLVRRALWLANLALGLVGMLALWLLREPVAIWVFGGARHASAVGWLGLGVLLTLIAGSQTALLQGLRRIGDVARVNIICGFLGAAVGTLVVYWRGADGVLWFVLTAPAVSVLVAGYYAARLPRPAASRDWQAIRQQWQAMLRLGIPLMAAGFLNLGTQLAARSIIVRELGLEASGHFQAAWTISMTYIGFVLGAMAADYYPRLTNVINDHAEARKVVTEQAEMGLLLAGPVLLAMITFAPWVIHLLYAKNFTPATNVLRWQVLGDVLKVASWPLGFILLAQGRGSIFIGVELAWNAIYLSAISLGIHKYGLDIAGAAFSTAYLISYGLLIVAARKLLQLKIQQAWPSTSILLLTGGMIILLSTSFTEIGFWLGVAATILFSVHSIIQINIRTNFRKRPQQ